MLTLDEILADPYDRFSVNVYPGVAWRAKRAETAPDSDTEWTGIEEPTGRVVMVMIGDNVEFSIDPDDVTRLDDDAYCPDCGQIGCAWAATYAEI